MIGKLLRARRASIAVYTGVMLPVLAGMAGLGSEYAYGVMSQSRNQRIADTAAYAGATAYATLGTTAAMDAAVSRMATLNGLAGTAAVASVVTSPATGGKSAVQVTVTTTQALALTQMVSSKSSLTIKASSYAEFTPVTSTASAGTEGCVLALNGIGTGVTLSGGTKINAPSCAVASNNTVTVPCGTYIVTPALKYNSAAAPTVGCGGITAPAGKTLTTSKAATADWLASNAVVTSATANYATVAALTAPTGPTAGSTPAAITFGWTTSGANAPSTKIASQSSNACSAAWSSGTSTWTVTCANNGNYTFGPIDLGGGITVKWAEAGTGSTYNFAGFVKVSGSKMTFGAGTYNIVAGLYTGGGSTTQFLQGATYRIGKYVGGGCNNEYSICHTGSSLTFAGPVNMTLSNGMDSGSTTMAIGTGSTANTYNLGPGSSSGKVFNVGGGGKLVLGDSLGSSFTAVGNLTTGGGSCLTLPAASQHWIKGSISASGGLTLGAGIYTINGYFALGESNGGSVNCTGSQIGLAASGVVLQIAGAATATGSCAGAVFCVVAGYTNVTLTAPTGAASGAGFAVIGPTDTSRTGTAIFGQGASGVSVSGVFYVPNGNLSLSGGAGVGDATGACLELLAKAITLSGGTALASTCAGLGGTGVGGDGTSAVTTASVALVK